MGFFEKKVNKWLAGFLLGTTVVVLSSNTKNGKTRWSKILDFLHNGFKELAYHVDEKTSETKQAQDSLDGDVSTDEK